MRKPFFFVAASALLCAMSFAQEPVSQDEGQQPANPPQLSLGEIARQVRARKQQRDAQLLQAKAKPVTNEDAQTGVASVSTSQTRQAHLVTKDESPEQSTITPAVERPAAASDAKAGSEDRNGKAAKWKSEILALKNEIASMQKETTELSGSIHYAGGDCIANCAQWNEKQQQKQQEVDSMKSQLEGLQKQLEDMQESARRDGFGSSVYDPSE